MGDFDPRGKNYEATDYVAVAASQTTAQISAAGGYIERIAVIPPSSTPGAVALLDGSTTLFTIPTGAGGDTKPYHLDLGIRSKSATGFKITTGASVAVVVVGQFTQLSTA